MHHAETPATSSATPASKVPQEPDSPAVEPAFPLIPVSQEFAPTPAAASPASWEAPIRKFDNQMIRQSLELTTIPTCVYELRTTGKTYSGYFNDPDKLAQAARELSGLEGVEGVYLTINPCRPELLARTNNTAEWAKRNLTTSDKDILRRTTFLIDVDSATRPSGISATNEEKASAATKTEAVCDHLQSLGFPKPLIADSGNGYHLRFRIDLTNDNESRLLLETCLRALAEKFNDGINKIDRTVFNASRICKIYGTLSAKGADMPERPHRICRILNQGDKTVVTTEQLKSLAATASKIADAKLKGPAVKTIANGLKLTAVPIVHHTWTPDEMETRLDLYGIERTERMPWERGWKWQVTCVTNPDHVIPDAFVSITPDDSGTLRPNYSCSHDSCKTTDPKRVGWNYFVRKLKALKPEVTADFYETEANTGSIFHTEAEYDTAKPLSFAITGFLQEDAVTFIGGLSGDGKTWILLSMAKALLEGTPLFNHAPFAVPIQADKVIYLIPESTLPAFKKRMVVCGLESYFRQKKFLVRTLSKDGEVDLSDPRIRKAAAGAHVFLDTAVRFMDGEEVVDSKKFAANVFAILRAGARSVTAAHHSSKAFEKHQYMSLENVLRGSGDIGALAATVWGVKQCDEKLNQVIVKNVKPRDFEPCEPFVIQGRPYLDETGTFKVIEENVVFDGKVKQFTQVIFSPEQMAVMATYDDDKRKKLLTILTRQRQNISVKKIAEEIGVSRPTVDNWRNEFEKKCRDVVLR